MKNRFRHHYGPAELEKCGVLLYGDRWQTEMAKNLGFANSRIIRYWLTRERHIPVYVWKKLVDLMKEKQEQFETLLKDFE